MLAGLGPTVVLKLALGRRAEKLREQLPDVLTIMASSLRAGHSFLQALDTTAKEIAQPAATEFQRVVAEIRLGRSAEDALGALAERVGSADFKWAVLAVNIQREVGGNLAEILDNVADTLRERATMRRQIRVLTSEGRLSAWVLALMPFAIALYMFVVNRDYIMLLFTTKTGLMMLGGAGHRARRRDPLDAEDRGHRCLRSGSSSRSRCVFFSVLLVGFALDASSTERKRAVRLLENQVSGSHRSRRPTSASTSSRRASATGCWSRSSAARGGSRGASRRSTLATAWRRSSCSPAARRAGTRNGSSRSR